MANSLNCNDLAKFQRVTKDVVTELSAFSRFSECRVWVKRYSIDVLVLVFIWWFVNQAFVLGDSRCCGQVVEFTYLLWRKHALEQCLLTKKSFLHRTNCDLFLTTPFGLDPPTCITKWVKFSPKGPTPRHHVTFSLKHVPNWDDQPRASIQPSLVSDEKFFCIEVDHEGRDKNDEDPMAPLRGVVTSVPARVFRTAVRILITRGAPLCSQLHFESIWRGYCAQRCKDEKFPCPQSHDIVKSDPDWSSFDTHTELKGFIQMTIRVLLGSDLGKAISQYGFVRMHPSAAAKMLGSNILL